MTTWSDLLDGHADGLGRLLADLAAEFICLTNLHGEPFYLNPAGRRLLGLDLQRDVSAINLRDYYADGSWTELRNAAIAAINRCGRWDGHCQLRCVPAGELLDMRTTMLRVKSTDDRPACLVILHYPTTEAEGLRATLAEVQARKNAILESSLDPIITINHAGLITEFNRAAEHTFGHSRDKVLGTKPSDVLFPPNASPDQEHRIDRYLTLGEGSLLGRRSEVVAMRADGKLFPAEIAMTLSREQGEPVLTFFVRDISRRKKAEMQQARYAAELERSNRELEQFAYVASHDLQEPLRKIDVFGQRLLQHSAEGLAPSGRDCVQRMQSAARRMRRLVDGLLQLSRVTTQGRQFVSVDLRQVANEVVSDLQANIEQVHGRVEIGELPSVEADPLQMRQLLQNLIANGLKFHRDKEPPIVKVSGRCVHVRRHHKDSPDVREYHCRIVVQDNGIGFDEQDRHRIFQMFQRLHPRDVFEGAGIGLALCRKIVERHEGRITARSTPGKGSVFEILLPITQTPD